MKSRFYILLSLKTPAGYECFGEYFLGDEQEQAENIFAGLKGRKDLTEQAMLHMDLMETVNELPVGVKSISCTLDEFTANCKFLSKEIFRLNNLKEFS